MEAFLNFKWIFIAGVICFLIYFVYDYLRLKLAVNKDIHFKDKDTEITSCILSKYPDVKPEFLSKKQKEMAIENNQEILDLDKKFKKLESRFDAIETYVRTVLKYNEEHNV